MHHIVVIVSLVLTLTVPLPRVSPPATTVQQLADPARWRIVVLVNAERRAAGLRPLTSNTLLMAEAQRFSGVQARLGRLSHRGTDGTIGGQRLTRAGYRWAFWGENLAGGYETPDQVVAAWMASPRHRAVLLSPLAREIGVGHTIKPNDPSGYIDYWVLEVARPR